MVDWKSLCYCVALIETLFWFTSFFIQILYAAIDLAKVAMGLVIKDSATQVGPRFSRCVRIPTPTLSLQIPTFPVYVEIVSNTMSNLV
jgi:hypothetical protein